MDRVGRVSDRVESSLLVGYRPARWPPSCLHVNWPLLPRPNLMTSTACWCHHACVHGRAFPYVELWPYQSIAEDTPIRVHV